MQVKKFEAKNMKDALDMVKTHLGPEAIILSAKENSGGFGLLGQNSVEVTAAISEETLRRKKYAESKLNSSAKEKFVNSSARYQKQFIEKVVNKYHEETDKRPTTQTQYIHISEEDNDKSHISEGTDFIENNLVGRSVEAASNQVQMTATQRIRSAAKDALRAVQFISDDEDEKVKKEKSKEKEQFHDQQLEAKNQKIYALQNELVQLKSIIEKFQSVPQTFVSGHPGVENGIPFELSFMYEKLLQAGVSEKNIIEILSIAKANIPTPQLKRKALIDAWVARFFLDQIQVCENWTRGKYHVFLGLAGQGKTTTLVKLASQMVIKEKKKVAIVTCDTFKIGAAEQLKIFAQILNVPFAQVKNASQWEIIEQKLRHFDHILVDMPGRSLKSVTDIEQLKNLMPPVSSKAVHYVQSVLSKDKEAMDVADRYRSFGFNDVIFTRLDESTQFGLIYNFQRQFKVPLHSFGIGTQVPEDYEAATKERVVDLIFKLTQIRKEKVNGSNE